MRDHPAVGGCAPALVARATNVSGCAARSGVGHGRRFEDYWQLHDWSVTHPEEFWDEVWNQLGVVSSAPYDAVLDRRTMPGARWFTGAQLNVVDQVLRFADRSGPAVVSVYEDGGRSELSWPQLRSSIASFAAALRNMGVVQGDRVVGYLPNGPEALVAFYATASLGAIWAGCAPDYGVSAAADRLSQLEPTVLVAATAYIFDGRTRDGLAEVAALAERLAVSTVERSTYET